MTHTRSRPIVVMQSAAASAAFLSELHMPVLLNGEHPDFTRRLQQALASATGQGLSVMPAQRALHAA